MLLYVHVLLTHAETLNMKEVVVTSAIWVEGTTTSTTEGFSLLSLPNSNYTMAKNMNRKANSMPPITSLQKTARRLRCVILKRCV